MQSAASEQQRKIRQTMSRLRMSGTMQNGRGRLPVGNITANPNLRDCLCNAARRGVVFLSHADFVLYNCDCLYLFRLSCLTNVPSAQVDPTGGCASVIPPNESGRPTACRFTYAVINPIRQVIPNDHGVRGKYTLFPQNQKYDFEKSRAFFIYLRRFLTLPLEESNPTTKTIQQIGGVAYGYTAFSRQSPYIPVFHIPSTSNGGAI